MGLKVTFLGTGTSAGVPLIACPCKVCTSTNLKDKRLRTSVMVEDNNTLAVIDSGPDFRQQMLRENVRKLDGLVFTHEHKDHMAGMDDIRAFNYIHNKKVDVYASPWVQSAIQREYPYIFSDEKYPGIPEINLHTIDNRPFKVGTLEFIPVEVKHYMLPVFGFRIGDFSYITDANFIPPVEKEKIKGSKVVVINALRNEPHVSHFTLSEALHTLEELKAETGYLIHISHQMGLHDEVENLLPDHVHIAYDGLKIEI